MHRADSLNKKLQTVNIYMFLKKNIHYTFIINSSSFDLLVHRVQQKESPDFKRLFCETHKSRVSNIF